MELCTISKDDFVHAAVYRSPVDTKGNIDYSGPKGPACGVRLNIFSAITHFEGDIQNVTCKKCLKAT